MLPSVWGSNTWYLLHILTLFPKRRQEIYRRFFSHLQYLLPCATCRNAYKEHMVAIPFPKRKEQNALWLIRVHNRVNQSIHKPVMEEQEMYSMWEREYVEAHTLTDIKWVDVGAYFLEGHPGSRRIDTETLQAHMFFWTHISELLPSKLQDVSALEMALQHTPITIDIVKSKTKYRIWFEKLQKELHMKKSIVTKECTHYCRL